MCTYELKGLAIITVAKPYDRPDNVLAIAKQKHIPYPNALERRIITLLSTVTG